MMSLSIYRYINNDHIDMVTVYLCWYWFNQI